MASTLAAKPADAEEGRGCIFISYRREDAGGHVLALVPLLAARFGAERIFKDVDNIPAGQDFVQAVQRSLASCAVLLVVIGREWLTIKDTRHGTRRLEDPDDMVRLEVATALQSEHVLVVPVLVGRATMPAAEDLPENLKTLARRNAVELSDIRWVSDTERLIRVIDSAAGLGSKGGTGLRALLQRRYIVSAAAVFTLVAALGLWQLRSPRTSEPRGEHAVPTTGISSRPEPTDSSRQNPSPPSAQTPPAGPDPRAITETPLTQATASGPKVPPGDRPNATTTTAAANRPKPPDAGKTRLEGRSAAAATTATSTPTPAPPPSTPASTGTIGQTATAQVAPPVAREEPPAARPAVEEDQRPAISAAIQRFRAAFNQKDPGAMREVFPSASIDKMFGKSKSCVVFTVDFGATRVTMLSPSSAKAEVQATYSCQPNTKQKAQVSDPATDVFVLERRGSSWFINDRLAAVD